MAETVKAYDVAAMFLRALGAPATPAMQRAVAIWLRFESGGTIVGNNPWNLHSGAKCPKERGFCPGQGSLPGQIGNRYAGSGDQNVAVFRTLEDGTKASANNLIRLAPSYGYGKVISEARSGDALGFLSALQSSSWSAGHYSYSKLVNAFKGSFNYNTALNIRSVGGGTTGDVAPGVDEKVQKALDLLKSIGISVDLSHVITKAEAEKIATDLYKIPLGNEISDKIVSEWTGKTVADFVNASVETGDKFSGSPFDALAGIGNIVAFALDPQNWLFIFALVGGIALAGYGFAQLTGARVGRPSLPLPSVEPETILEEV